MSTHSPSPARRQNTKFSRTRVSGSRQIKRNGPSNVDSFGGGTGSGFEISHWGNKKTKRQQSGLKKDWSVSLARRGRDRRRRDVSGEVQLLSSWKPNVHWSGQRLCRLQHSGCEQFDDASKYYRLQQPVCHDLHRH